MIGEILKKYRKINVKIENQIIEILILLRMNRNIGCIETENQPSKT